MPKKRFRLRYTFWLDLQKADENTLANQIEILKGKHTFASTIRDGIRLICDLRTGRTDVLFELFPWVKEALQPKSGASVDNSVQEQIARLEALLIAQGNVPLQPPLARPSQDKRPRQLEKPLVEITSSTGKASAELVAKNFISSLANMASGFFD